MTRELFGKESLFPALRGIAALEGEARSASLREAAEDLGLSYAQAYGAASFYSAFNGLNAETRMEPTVQRRDMLLGGGDFSDIPGQAQAEPEKALAALDASGLTGRGGAGFPVGKKWKSVRENNSAEKYVFCNGSEGESGTCKDLALFLNVPETVVAGVLTCCRVVGARHAAFYIRAGYEDAAARLEEAVAAVKDSYPDIDIQVLVNGGAYVCGEETGLLSSAEGGRGEPRLKPPYPGEAGFRGAPTVINNAETFACVPHILRLGAEEFRRRETKLFSVSGCGTRAGVYELDAAVTLEQIYALSGGSVPAKAAQLGGGASGALLPAEYFDVPLTPGSCREAGFSLGTGSVRFIAEDESIPALCRDIAVFFRNEGCGKCTPCRNGGRRMAELLEAALAHQAEETFPEDIRALALHMQRSSRCALGMAAPTALLWALRYFEEEFTALSQSGREG